MQYAYKARTIIAVPKIYYDVEKNNQQHSRAYNSILAQILRDFKSGYPITIYAMHNRSHQYSIPYERFTYVLYRELIDLRNVKHIVVHGHAPSGVSIPHFVSYKSTWGNCPRLRLKNTAPYDSANFNDHPVYNIKQEKNVAQTTTTEPDIGQKLRQFLSPSAN